MARKWRDTALLFAYMCNQGIGGSIRKFLLIMKWLSLHAVDAKFKSKTSTFNDLKSTDLMAINSAMR